MYKFKAIIEIIGVNPFVFVPENILQQIIKKAGKDKSPIQIKGKLNEKPYKQTLVKFQGHWRLYINTTMLKNSPKQVGEMVEISIDFDPETRAIKAPDQFLQALKKDPSIQAVFNNLTPSRKLEIVRYLARLKSEDTLNRNIIRALDFLAGKGRFVGRDKP